MAEKERFELSWENRRRLIRLRLHGNAAHALFDAAKEWIRTGEGPNPTTFEWLKQADGEQLEDLPGIGPYRAQRTLDFVAWLRDLVRDFTEPCEEVPDRKAEVRENWLRLLGLRLNWRAALALNQAAKPYVETGEGPDYTSFTWLKSASLEDLDEISDIGPVFAQEILDLLNKVRALVEDFGDPD